MGKAMVLLSFAEQMKATRLDAWLSLRYKVLWSSSDLSIAQLRIRPCVRSLLRRQMKSEIAPMPIARNCQANIT
jgi:hypothetical protein